MWVIRRKKRTCLPFQEWSPGMSTMALEVISSWLTHTLAHSHTPTFGLCLQKLSTLDFHVLSFIEGLIVSKPLFHRTSNFNTIQSRKKSLFYYWIIMYCFKNPVEQRELEGRDPQNDTLYRFLWYKWDCANFVSLLRLNWSENLQQWWENVHHTFQDGWCVCPTYSPKGRSIYCYGWPPANIHIWETNH